MQDQNISYMFFQVVYPFFLISITALSTANSGGAEVVGALRTTLPLGPPMENKFQDPDTKTPTNVLSSPWLKKILNSDAPEWRI